MYVQKKIGVGKEWEERKEKEDEGKDGDLEAGVDATFTGGEREAFVRAIVHPTIFIVFPP